MLGQIFGSSIEHLAMLITLHEKKLADVKSKNNNKTCQQSIVLQLRFYRQDSDLLDVKVVLMYILKLVY